MDSLPTRLTPPLFWDSNAGWPLDPNTARRALEHWIDVESNGANASSRHQIGRHARAVWSQAIEQIQVALDVPAPSRSEVSSQVVVTHSGSESNTLVIRGWIAKQIQAANPWTWICSQAEHDSIWELLDEARSAPLGQVMIVDLSPSGMIQVETIHALLKDVKLRHRQVMLSTQWVNHELGTVQPMRAILAAVRGHTQEVFWHVDAAQAWGRVSLSLKELGADAVTFSGHKLGAGSGSGLVWLRQPESILPLVPGVQQHGLRGGSYPLGTALLIAEALQTVPYSQEREERFALWRAEMHAFAQDRFGSAYTRLGDPSEQVGGIWMASLLTRDKAAPRAPWVDSLDRLGICVSNGSACSSGATQASHIISAISLTLIQRNSLIRCSPLNPPTKVETVQFFERLAYIWRAL